MRLVEWNTLTQTNVVSELLINGHPQLESVIRDSHGKTLHTVGQDCLVVEDGVGHVVVL